MSKILLLVFIFLAYSVLLVSTVGLISESRGYQYTTIKESGLLGLLGFRKVPQVALDTRNFNFVEAPETEEQRLAKELEKTATGSSIFKEATPTSSPAF